jgi:hypothetical protein
VNQRILCSVYNISKYILLSENINFQEKPSAKHIFIDALIIEAEGRPNYSNGDFFKIDRSTATILMLLQLNGNEFPFILLCQEVDQANRSDDDRDFIEIGEEDLDLEELELENPEFNLYDSSTWSDGEIYGFPENWKSFAIDIKESIRNLK